ncbi:bifunctional DNA-formamidopyrimidine glycosylase/DNA-(apurinic or apyrimidinic site) lyase [Flaviflexus ciconiae]|uniref:Bifunctional DNA-formamidopyrimidine glycosylase/DNA-(Apurinic or apyrimidinic site) lyase n=1 Tax=Flaviflexus ciconiae TaxID=2496867 RepID=A0A3S9PWS6_9ACTO|nr:bifunctional DNA-formamidopyrimidine glycosylase/DNA-(apurinic or apyrimidinic site) lyase [Flaviflexus ciconiae]AZQ76809.1 bifunctional DNA-formamidopyrimidine glycosylase/DNA-(apurinic or apyrimidinic site) lyase [Flaviflexus ciconiae]
MPELPEVETVREGLDRLLKGKTLQTITPLHPRAVRRSEGDVEGLQAFAGSQVEAVARRGKYLWFEMSGMALNFHLGMSGQLLVSAPGIEPLAHPHLRALIRFEDGTHLRFIDQRTFGYIQRSSLVEVHDGAPAGKGTTSTLIPVPVSHIARDLLDPALEITDLNTRTRAKRTEIKRAMLDQTLVSGMGNIYCDEALYRAKINPRRKTNGLSYIQLTELWTQSIEVLREALEQGGTSFDTLYVNVNGASGYFERSLRAYGRGGQPCLKCGAKMKKIQFMNRSSTFCPICQPLARY